MRNTATPDDIGRRGESIFHSLITKSFNLKPPIFRPQFLGDKWPTLDFFVELLGTNDITPYFFVQVKTTRAGYTSRTNRLKIAVSGEEMRKLASFPAPTYLAGIDEIQEEGYILSANGEYPDGFFGFPTLYPINQATRDLLYKEVQAYWRQTSTPGAFSGFLDPRWTKS